MPTRVPHVIFEMHGGRLVLFASRAGREAHDHILDLAWRRSGPDLEFARFVICLAWFFGLVISALGSLCSYTEGERVCSPAWQTAFRVFVSPLVVLAGWAVVYFVALPGWRRGVEIWRETGGGEEYVAVETEERG